MLKLWRSFIKITWMLLTILRSLQMLKMMKKNQTWTNLKMNHYSVEKSLMWRMKMIPLTMNLKILHLGMKIKNKPPILTLIQIRKNKMKKKNRRRKKMKKNKKRNKRRMKKMKRKVREKITPKTLLLKPSNLIMNGLKPMRSNLNNGKRTWFQWRTQPWKNNWRRWFRNKKKGRWQRKKKKRVRTPKNHSLKIDRIIKKISNNKFENTSQVNENNTGIMDVCLFDIEIMIFFKTGAMNEDDSSSSSDNNPQE